MNRSKLTTTSNKGDKLDGRPTLVALHGWGQTSRAFDPLRKALASKVDLITPDFPGHGENKGDSGPFAYSRYCKEIATLIETRLGGEKFHLLGWSMGGTVAARYVLENFGQAPESLTLLSATPRFVAPNKGSIGMGQPAIVIEKMITRLSEYPEEGLRAFIALFFASGEVIADEDRDIIERHLIDSKNFPPDAKALLETLKELAATDLTLRSEAPENIPLLLIYGGLDTITPNGGQELWKSLFSNVTVNKLDGIGHAPHLTATRSVADLLTSFIESLE